MSDIRGGLWARAETMPDLLQARAEQSPTSPALRTPDFELDSAQLLDAVRRLASEFAEQDVAEGDLVALCVERGPWPFLASAALLWLGAAYVPLDPHHPLERIEYVLADAGIDRVLVDAAGAELLAGSRYEKISLDPATLTSTTPPITIPAAATSDGIAYVLHTSGSTGSPKGVRIRHRNVLAMLSGICPLFDFAPDEVWPLIHAHTFDVSVWEMWGATAAGACLLTVSESQARDPLALAMHLADAGVTTLHVVPSVFRHVAEVVHEDSLDLPLRRVVFAGEPMDRSLISRWRQRPAGRSTTWFNVYGVTEAAVYNTLHELTDSDLDDENAATPIGRALRGSPVRIVDAELLDVPPGVAGELLIGGPQVSDGYLNRVELTQERFVETPGSDGRWYRSGDAAIMDQDGAVRYVGRLDDQVKVQGVRIEPGEVEHALRSVPWIRDAVVVATRTRRGETQLGAAIVAGTNDGSPGSERDWRGDVRGALAETLPQVMIPQKVVAIDRLPQTPSGKVDRQQVVRLLT